MAGSKYQLSVEARLDKSKALDMDLRKKLADMKAQNLDVFNIRTKFDEKGLKNFTIRAKGVDGAVTAVTGSVSKATGVVKNLTTVTDKAGKSTNYFAQGMLQSAKSAAQYALSIGLIYSALAKLGEGIGYIKELDKSLTDAQIVTGYTDAQVDDLASSYNVLAKELKITTLEVAEGSLEFLRQGKTIEETSELVRSSAIMAKLGNLDAAESTKYLTSIMNAYKMEVSELPAIIDKIIQLDNTFATSTQEVAAALQRSAVSGQQAGVSLEELSSMIAVISQVSRREGEVVGTALRTIFTRFQDIAKGKLDEDGMGINNVDDALRRVGISIRDDTGQFREFTSVLEELYPIWKDLDSIERANIAKSMAGTRQRESFLILLENETLYRKGLTEQMVAEGLAIERYDTYLGSLAASQAHSTAAWEGMWAATIESDAIKWYYDFSAAIGEAIAAQGGLISVLNDAGPKIKNYGEESNVVWDSFKKLHPEIRKNADIIPELTDEMKKASDTTDGWADRLGYLAGQMGDGSAEAAQLESIVTEFTETFQNFIEQTESLSDGDTGISGITEDFTELNKMFAEGSVDADTYFAQMNAGLDSLDMTQTFAGNEEAASTFFTGLVFNAADSISHINELWNTGEISLTEYTESLIGVGDMFARIGEMAEFMGVDSVVTDAISEITSGVDSLTQAQEMNIIVQDAMHQVTQESLQFGTEAYNTQMQLVSQAMAASGVMYQDTTGKALKGANDIYGYLTATDGNFQRLTEQSGKATGSMIQTVVNGAGKMITGLADMIKGFNAQIYFTPTITGGGGSIIDMLLGKSPLPTVTFDVGANVSSAGTPDMSLSAITGGGYESTFGDAGDGGMLGALSGFGEQLTDWTPGDIDYGAPAGQMEELEDTVGSLANAFKDLQSASGKTAKEIKEDAKSIDDLLDMVVKKIKQEQKAKKDSLKDELEGYKKIIDLRKDLLKSMKEEDDYQDSLRENQQDLSRVQGEIEEVRLDDSEAGLARLRELQEEQAEIQSQIDDDASDRAIELQEDALDTEYENFKSYIGDQIELIDEYLSQPGSIVADALDLIGAKGETLYSDLISYNSIYGSGITNDVVSAWEDAYDALAEYGGLLGITGNTGGIPTIASSSTAGLDVRTMTSPSTTSNTSSSGAINIGSLISVSGSVDSAVMPSLENLANRVVEKLNDAVRVRGFGQRDANQYSI